MKWPAILFCLMLQWNRASMNTTFTKNFIEWSEIDYNIVLRRFLVLKFVCLYGTKLITVLDECVTPLNRRSICVSINDCQELRSVFDEYPKKIPSNVRSFLRQSHCGFESWKTPKVCCGPLPRHYQKKLRPTQVDPVVTMDSDLMPRHECGIDTNGDRIIGGNATDLDEFPWMALLGYRQRRNAPLSYDCGGFLINRRYILTAAHCVTGIQFENKELVSVRLGEYDTRFIEDCLSDACAEPVQEIVVHSTYPHPGYKQKRINRKDDIALVRLAKSAKFTYFVYPICLVDKNPRLEVGSELYVAGWGVTNYESKEKSPVKLKVNLPLFKKSECVMKYRIHRAYLTDKQLCAGGVLGKDTCPGDSGGPLMRRNSGIWEAVGITSFGNKCGKDGWPGVFTSVYSYKDWIKSTMRSSNI